jgi:pimeloyl-ACP methyl ester carboxylesterase
MPSQNLACPEYRLQGEGPLLVYIAGLDGTGELLFKQIPDLSQYYRVVTFRSREGSDFDYNDLANDVAAIIVDLGEKRATVVGESFGGTVALWFALKFPHLLDRLVIVNSFPRFHARFRIAVAAILARWMPHGITWAARFISNNMGLSIDRVNAESRRRFFAIVKTVDHEAYTRRLELIRGFNVESRLNEIRAPVLLIAAENDIVLPSAKEATAMAAQMPNVTVKIVRSAGHAVLLGDRFRLADAMTQWSEDVGRRDH